MLRAVMAGCGQMAKGWLRAIAASPELAGRVAVVGLVDLDSGRARDLAQEFNLDDAATSSDLEAMLAALSPDLLFDVVVPSARHDVVAAGLRHGCHVLSEKPMAASLAEARDLVDLAARAGRIHAVVQNRRYVAGIRRLRAFVESGAIGPLTGVHADFFIGAHFGGFREEMENVLLLDMAIHTFDAARFLIGTAPRAVYCHEANPPGSWYAGGATAEAIFEFEDRVVFTYRGSWVAEGARTSWESAWRLVGTRGTLLWDGADSFTAAIAGEGTGLLRDPVPVAIPELADASRTHGHASVLADFLAAVETGRPPETEGRDNIRSLAMVFAAIESAASRRRVEIPTEI